MKKIFKSTLFVIASVAVSAVYLTISLFIFSRSTNNLIDTSTKTYLSENVKAMAAIFNTKLEDQLVMLESQVRYYQDIDLSDYNSMKERILTTKGIGAFKNIGVANATGATVNQKGKSSGNIMLSDYFKEAMTGVSSVSENTSIDENGDEVLCLAVPIMQNGKAVGVVYGTFTKDMLNRLVETVSFGESSANVLYDDSGAIIAHTTDNEYLDGNDVNFYDLVGRRPETSDDNIFPYDDEGRQMLAAECPIGLHGWHFATLINASMITDVSDTIGRYVIYIIITITIVFALLLTSILTLMRNLSKIKRESARISAELGVATRIQADMLPTDFPEEDDIKLYATMTPAKEVGGDFYDFFYTDKDHIAMVMADVAGKGVPAALFMVVAKVVIRNQVMAGGSPADILFLVNNILCRNNPGGLFVTVWLGILDINTGVIEYVNAGHEYPVIGRAGKGFEVKEDENCPPLAAMEDMEFVNESVTLGAGDSLFLYTDGVPEAKNAGGARFGMDALIKGLDEDLGKSAADLVVNLKKKVDSFAGDIDPFDDITMMCLNYLGRK